MKILIIAGGTGGHVFPALALAQAFRARGDNVRWLGTRLGQEAALVCKARFPLHYLTITGVRGKRKIYWLMAPFLLLIALSQALWVIGCFRPDRVIAMGGFVAGPGGVAAWILRRRLIIHEQNAVAGTTNRALAYLANDVLASFAGSFPKKFKVTVTGNPIRASFGEAIEKIQKEAETNYPEDQPSQLKLRLFILGGSQGALAINQLMPEVLGLVNRPDRIEVWHQTGPKHIDLTKKQYKKYYDYAETQNRSVQLSPFITDMPKAYTWANCVIARAGAMTVSELASVGVGSILIPFPYAIDDHQTKNAQQLVAVGGAVLIQQSDCQPAVLKALLEDFLEHPKKLLLMGQKAQSNRHLDAVSRIIKICS